jgi:hypothetical protein
VPDSLKGPFAHSAQAATTQVDSADGADASPFPAQTPGFF